jgi:hypothetical protein
MANKLAYAATALAPGDMRDIWGGRKVKELVDRGWFMNGNDFAMVLGTDGGVLFKRTGVHIWPIWGTISNLSPQDRCVSRNVYVCMRVCVYVNCVLSYRTTITGTKRRT